MNEKNIPKKYLFKKFVVYLRLNLQLVLTN